MCTNTRLAILGFSFFLLGLSGCAGMNSHRLFNSNWFDESIKNGQAFDPRAREIEQRLGLSEELGYERSATRADREF